jgi:hypothetical protein
MPGPFYSAYAATLEPSDQIGHRPRETPLAQSPTHTICTKISARTVASGFTRANGPSNVRAVACTTG